MIIDQFDSARRPSAYTQPMDFRPYPQGYVAWLEAENRKLAPARKRWWKRLTGWVSRQLERVRNWPEMDDLDDGVPWPSTRKFFTILGMAVLCWLMLMAFVWTIVG